MKYTVVIEETRMYSAEVEADHADEAKAIALGVHLDGKSDFLSVTDRKVCAVDPEV